MRACVAGFHIGLDEIFQVFFSVSTSRFIASHLAAQPASQANLPVLIAPLMIRNASAILRGGRLLPLGKKLSEDLTQTIGQVVDPVQLRVDRADHFQELVKAPESRHNSDPVGLKPGNDVHIYSFG